MPFFVWLSCSAALCKGGATLNLVKTEGAQQPPVKLKLIRNLNADAKCAAA